MSRTFALASLAALALAGCGDTCSSAPAQAQALPLSCTLPAGASTTIPVQLCAQCTDSSPSCVGEFLTDHFELDTSFQQCQAQQGCNIGAGCGTVAVNCTVTTPTTPGNYQIIAGSTQFTGTANVQANAAASCSL